MFSASALQQSQLVYLVPMPRKTWLSYSKPKCLAENDKSLHQEKLSFGGSNMATSWQPLSLAFPHIQELKIFYDVKLNYT